MKLQEFLDMLTAFSTEIDKLGALVDPKEIEYDQNNPDEKFLYDELIISVLDNILYAKDLIEYLSKNVSYTGFLRNHTGHFYIDDIMLEKNDIIEVYVCNEWRRLDVYFIDREFYLPLDTDNNVIIEGIRARIRLSKEELDMRNRPH